MNCKNCEYGLKQSCGDFEKILCTYEEGECVKITELEKENAELKKQVEQKQHLADVRCEQSIENYKLFSDERKKRIDTDIALEDMTDNLTKAKEIIKDLYFIIESRIDYEDNIPLNDSMNRAKDFLIRTKEL